jgi:hypothetical protein
LERNRNSSYANGCASLGKNPPSTTPRASPTKM